MIDSLLPPNATKLERDLETLLAHSNDLPVAIKTLWDPWTCPVSLLPWLAWANSVDDWQESWPDAVKRRVIADAFDVHRYKGTPYSVQKALDSLGVQTDILEWWEPAGSGQRGTMTVSALLNENIAGSGEGLINAQMLRLITTAINNSKRGSIHYDLELGIYFEENFTVTAGLADGVGISCADPESNPLEPGESQASAALYAAEHRIELSDRDINGLTVLPDQAVGQIAHIGGAHQLAISNVELTGVS